MSILTEIKKEEAIKRMRLLGLSDKVIIDFNDGIINMSLLGYNIPVLNEILTEIIKLSELENLFVYYVIHDNAGMTSILYISDYEEDWDTEDNLLDHGIVYAYVINHMEPCFSEIGSIQVKNINGRLERIA